jgi:hypothetical protein
LNLSLYRRKSADYSVAVRAVRVQRLGLRDLVFHRWTYAAVKACRKVSKISTMLVSSTNKNTAEYAV